MRVLNLIKRENINIYWAECVGPAIRIKRTIPSENGEKMNDTILLIFFSSNIINK